jgi:hypothetical protein
MCFYASELKKIISMVNRHLLLNRHQQKQALQAYWHKISKDNLHSSEDENACKNDSFPDNSSIGNDTT